MRYLLHAASQVSENMHLYLEERQQMFFFFFIT